MNVRSCRNGKRKMKKDLRTLGWALGVGALFASFPSLVSAQSRSTDGATHAFAQGRTVLGLEDVKILLGLQGRLPSSNSNSRHDVVTSLKMSVSKKQRKELHRQVITVEKQRHALLNKLDHENIRRKAEIRKSRRSIQVSRLNAQNDKDMSLSKNLFENLLAEGNLAGRHAHALSEFDANHVFVIEFHEVHGVKQVENVFVGQQRPMNTATTMVAHK